MRVFISWSGDPSRQLAEAIHGWLQNVLQFVKPYFTPNNVDKGTRWPSEISDVLSKSTFGIIALTPNNLESPWIHFEAGAISRTVEKGMVAPILFGLEPTDVSWPLAQFQACRFTKDDIRHLICTINTAAGENKLSDNIVDSAFDKWWPDLKTKINIILESAKSPPARETVRKERDLLEEVLSLVRNISSRQEQLESSQRMVAALMRPNPLYPPFAQPTILGGMLTDVPPLPLRQGNAPVSQLDIKATEQPKKS